MRRALTLEQLGAAPTHRGIVLGPAVVVVDEELHGEASEALAALDRWLVGGHHMRRDRLHPTTGSWTRRRGILGTTYRSLRHATGEGHLGDLERIDVVALDTGAGTCVVRVIADRRRERRARGVAGAAVGGVATVGAVVGAVGSGPGCCWPRRLPSPSAPGSPSAAAAGRDGSRARSTESSTASSTASGRRGWRPTSLAAPCSADQPVGGAAPRPRPRSRRARPAPRARARRGGGRGARPGCAARGPTRAGVPTRPPCRTGPPLVTHHRAGCPGSPGSDRPRRPPRRPTRSRRAGR